MQPMINAIVPENFFTGRITSTNTGVKLTADDKFEILDVVYRFEWSVDAQHFEALGELMTDDIVIDHVFGFRQGRKAVLALLKDVVPSRGLRHQNTNPVIYLNDDGSVSVTSYLLVVQVAEPPQERTDMPYIVGHAIVTDIVRNVNGNWKLARRTFEQMRIPEAYSLSESVRQRLESPATERAAMAAV